MSTYTVYRKDYRFGESRFLIVKDGRQIVKDISEGLSSDLTGMKLSELGSLKENGFKRFRGHSSVDIIDMYLEDLDKRRNEMNIEEKYPHYHSSIKDLTETIVGLEPEPHSSRPASGRWYAIQTTIAHTHENHKRFLRKLINERDFRIPAAYCALGCPWENIFDLPIKIDKRPELEKICQEHKLGMEHKGYRIIDNYHIKEIFNKRLLPISYMEYLYFCSHSVGNKRNLLGIFFNTWKVSNWSVSKDGISVMGGINERAFNLAVVLEGKDPYYFGTTNYQDIDPGLIKSKREEFEKSSPKAMELWKYDYYSSGKAAQPRLAELYATTL